MTDTQTQAEGINPESLKKASELLMSRRSPNCGENFLKEDAYNAVFIIAELESLVVRERQKNKEMEERIGNKIVESEKEWNELSASEQVKRLGLKARIELLHSLLSPHPPEKEEQG